MVFLLCKIWYIDKINGQCHAEAKKEGRFETRIHERSQKDNLGCDCLFCLKAVTKFLSLSRQNHYICSDDLIMPVSVIHFCEFWVQCSCLDDCERFFSCIEVLRCNLHESRIGVIEESVEFSDVFFSELCNWFCVCDDEIFFNISLCDPSFI